MYNIYYLYECIILLTQIIYLALMVTNVPRNLLLPRLQIARDPRTGVTKILFSACRCNIIF